MCIQRLFGVNLEGETSRFTALTLFMSVDGPYVAFEMLPPVEAFATAFDFTDIRSLVLGHPRRFCGLLCRHTAPSAFLGEIWHGDRKSGAGSRAAAFRRIARGCRALKKSQGRRR